MPITFGINGVWYTYLMCASLIILYSPLHSSHQGTSRRTIGSLYTHIGWHWSVHKAGQPFCHRSACAVVYIDVVGVHVETRVYL